MSEKESLEGSIRELIKKNEEQESEFKRQIEKMQREMDDQIYAKVREDTQNSKDLQQELLKELQASEAKYRELQKKYIDVQGEMKNIQANLEKQILEEKAKHHEMVAKLKIQEGQDQKRLEVEKRFEGERRKILLELESRQEKVQSLEATRLDLAKKLTYLESESSQLRMKNVLLKESCDTLKNENEALKEKSNREFRDFESSIAEMELKHSQERDFLERELKRMKEMYEVWHFSVLGFKIRFF